MNREPPSSSHVVWAIRLDWAVDGTHEFVCGRPDLASAGRTARRIGGYWQRGPIRPVLSIVAISTHEFWLHARLRRLCQAPDCASTTGTPPEPAARWTA